MAARHSVHLFVLVTLWWLGAALLLLACRFDASGTIDDPSGTGADGSASSVRDGSTVGDTAADEIHDAAVHDAANDDVDGLRDAAVPGDSGPAGDGDRCGGFTQPCCETGPSCGPLLACLDGTCW